MCVYVCGAMHLCLWIHACVLLPEHQHMQKKDDAQMAAVHVVVFSKQLACHFLIDTDQNMDQCQPRSVFVNVFLF